MFDGDFRGDRRAEFTREEAAAIREAEGREPRRYTRRPRRRPRGRTEGPPGSGLFLVALLGFVFAVGFSEMSKAHRHVQTAAAQTPSTLDHAPPGPGSPGARETRREESPNVQGARDERGGTRLSTAPASPLTDIPRRYLPPGWDQGISSGDITLLAEPQAGAPTVAQLPRDTNVIMRRLGQSDPCWHVVVSEDAALWGYACLDPGARDNGRSPLPQGWFHAEHHGAPARLRSAIPQSPVIGIIQVGTEIVLHRIGETASYFVLSEDGRDWGYADLLLRPLTPQDRKALVPSSSRF